MVAHKSSQLSRSCFCVFLKLLHPPVVGFNGVLQNCILQGRGLVIEFDATFIEKMKIVLNSCNKGQLPMHKYESKYAVISVCGETFYLPLISRYN